MLYINELEAGNSGLAFAKPSTILAFPLLTSINIKLGPELPRASKLIAKPTCLHNLFLVTNNAAPFKPNSSASVNRIIISFLCFELFSKNARTDSRIVAIPVASSAAPCEKLCGAES